MQETAQLRIYSKPPQKKKKKPLAILDITNAARLTLSVAPSPTPPILCPANQPHKTAY